MLSTPTKPVRRGPQPKEENVNDFCRFCKRNLRSAKLSSENLFKPSRRQDSVGVVLANECEQLGIVIHKGTESSERICSPCGRKIKNAAEIVSWLNEKIVDEHRLDADDNTEPQRQKRVLSTTITPERKSNTKVQRGTSTSAKNLFQISKEISNVEDELDDKIKHLMNIDTIDAKEESKVRVLVAYPNGHVSVTENLDKITTTMIRSIVQKKWRTAVNAIFKHKALCEEIPDVVRRQVSDEFKALSTESTLRGSSPEELCSFSNRIFMHEVKVKCPVWYAAVNGAIGLDLRESDDRRRSCLNQMALSTSVLARQRNPSLSAIAYRISMVLFHSGISYYDTIRLSHLGICMSPQMVVALQKKMGNACDSRLLLWKKNIEEVHAAIELLNEIQDKQVPKLGEDDMEIDVAVNISEEHLKASYTTYDKSAYQLCVNLINEDMERKNETSVTSTTIQDVLYILKTRKLPYYKIVGDNIDAHINARYQSTENTNQSIHWTQQYSVLDRVNEPLDNTESKKALNDIQLADLLPVKEVQDAFKRNCAVLIGRLIVKYLQPFHSMKDVVEYHIPHHHSKEMSKKSDICCLGLQFKNPNIAGEMAQLLMTNQEKYVPCLHREDQPVTACRIPLHGDQLFEERARNVQWTFLDGCNSYDRLEGIITEAADWHAKLNLYSIEFETFVSDDSAGEIGTSRASMNRIGKTRAAQGVKKFFNEYKDFHQCEIQGHICASFMEMVNMNDVNDENCDLNIPDKSAPKETRKAWFSQLCHDYIEMFFGDGEMLTLVNRVDELQTIFQNRLECRQDGCQATFVHHSRRVIHEIEVHGLTVWTGDEERDFFGYYYCRAKCGRVYSTISTRNRHEKTDHPDYEVNETHETPKEDAKDKKDSEDHIYNYHRAKLVFGLLLLEFEDAIKEGDGDRVLNVYKIALLFYKNNNHTKYAYITLLYLVNENAALTAFQANSLKHNRFYNKFGGIGRNIPLDLKMEQLNKVLKSMWRGLGANLNETNASRVANAIEVTECLLDSVDRDCALSGRHGYRSNKNSDKSVKQIISDLKEKKVFKYTVSREGYPSFQKFNANLLHGLDYRDLHKWMKQLIGQWQKVLPNQK